MNDRKLILSSLALDLRRVAQGYHRGSYRMADRFLEEALKRKTEAEKLEEKAYIKKFLKKLEDFRTEKDTTKKAEDALTYSVIFQNAAFSV